MTPIDLRTMEVNVARGRVVLSLAATLVVYLDPEVPLVARWIPFTSGPYTMDPRLIVVMAAHIAYSTAVYLALRYREMPEAFAERTVWADVLFGVVIATMTQGVTGPSYAFFAFAVMASALRGGLRQALVVTAVDLVLYVVLHLFVTGGRLDLFIMRPVYLAITGYLVSYLGQQRQQLEERMRVLEASAERMRIGRDLHDGYAQALAGVTLRLEATRRLLSTGAVAQATEHLTDLQAGVTREYDELRRYVRSLAGVTNASSAGESDRATNVQVHIDMAASLALVDQVLAIAREGLSNVGRHARAGSATVAIRQEAATVHVTIDDDGVGLPADATPWSIASRVKELGGRLQIAADGRPGAHVAIALPLTSAG
jgi:signal transduction histidine kinase